MLYISDHLSMYTKKILVTFYNYPMQIFQAIMSLKEKLMQKKNSKLFLQTVKNQSFFLIIGKLMGGLFLAVLATVVFYVMVNYFKIQIVKNTAAWFGVLLLFYWVVSAVWCLYDKDDYGRNVSASDDFYNVSITSFWLVEGFLLGLFVSYAKTFDAFEPLLESDVAEELLLNEETDVSDLRSAFVFILAAYAIVFFVDILLAWESYNPNYVLIFFIVVFILFSITIVDSSARFIEDMDIEDDGEDLFDDNDTVFEHEDFTEEGVDGGDWAEGLEILQIFFGYWHYVFIYLHITFIIYALISANGKQTHLYWAVLAVTQNVVLILLMDFLEWLDILEIVGLVPGELYYSNLYFSEDSFIVLEEVFSELKNIILFFLQ